MESLLKRIEAIPGKCILESQLSTSLISQVYLCRFNDTKAVIRFDSPLASKLAIDRENEANLLKNITIFYYYFTSYIHFSIFDFPASNDS